MRRIAHERDADCNNASLEREADKFERQVNVLLTLMQVCLVAGNVASGLGAAFDPHWTGKL